MNVLERVREIGVLRAAGMTRRQVWRSVVVEAGVTGLVGAVCGIAAGIGVGALMVVLRRRSPRPTRRPCRGRRSASPSSSASSWRCSPRPTRPGWPAASRSSAPSATSSPTVVRPGRDGPSAVLDSRRRSPPSVTRPRSLDDHRHPATRSQHGRRARPDHRRLPGPGRRSASDSAPGSGTSSSSPSGAVVVALSARRSSSRPSPCRSPGRRSASCSSAGPSGCAAAAAALLLYLAIGVIGVPVYAEGNAGLATIERRTGGLPHRLRRRGRPSSAAGRARLGSTAARLARRDGHRHGRHLRHRRAVAEGRDRHARGPPRSPAA